MIFRNLANLRELYLDNNDLHTIEAGTFVALHQLKSLNLQHNSLSKAFVNTSLDLIRLHNLLQINLSHNRLATIPTINSSTMVLIDLSHNNISQFSMTDIDISSHQLPKLLVNLSRNSIKAIDFTHFDSMDDQILFEKIGRYVTIDLNYNPNLICGCDNINFLNFIRTKTAFKIFLVFLVDTLLCSTQHSFAGKPISEIDPNNFTCPFNQCPNDHCSCSTQANVLTVNCSNSNLTTMPILSNVDNVNKFYATKLYIENNCINELTSSTNQTDFYNSITEIYARNNCLTVLHSTHLPAAIIRLDISANHLTRFGSVASNIFNKTLKLELLKLSLNAWQCDCDAVFVKIHSAIISDYDQVYCVNKDNKRFSGLQSQDLCSESDVLYVVGIVVVSIVGLLLGIMVAIYYKYQQELKFWLYRNNCCVRFLTDAELDKDKLYDAFVSYSHKDVQFVLELASKLEQDPYNFKLCLHDRDWMAGELITNLVGFISCLDRIGDEVS